MKCPYCGSDRDNVIDSRKAEDGRAVRRRRECEACGKRFTTYERVMVDPIIVVKKDGTRTLFDRIKIESGILRACNKRPITIEDIRSLVDTIEEEILNSASNEVTTDRIGEMTLERLKKLDLVAYIRFASVYREFNDASEFINELNKIKSNR